jgi:hypothetical protein
MEPRLALNSSSSCLSLLSAGITGMSHLTWQLNFFMSFSFLFLHLNILSTILGEGKQLKARCKVFIMFSVLYNYLEMIVFSPFYENVCTLGFGVGVCAGEYRVGLTGIL